MESRIQGTQAVDRLLETISPSLSAELERILQESREQLETEFQTRLESALRDAELATLHLAEVRLEESVMAAREATRVQLTEGFEQQLIFAAQQIRTKFQTECDEGMQAALQQLSTEFEKKSAELQKKSDEAMQAAFANWTAERTELQGQLRQWHTYAEAQRQLSECTSQAEILTRFMKLSEPFAPSLAIYVAKPDGLILWKTRGGGAFPELVSPDTIDPELYFKPAMVRSKMVAAVCAARPGNIESMDFLMSCLERTIESFGLKLHTRAPLPPVSEAAANV